MSPSGAPIVVFLISCIVSPPLGKCALCYSVRLLVSFTIEIQWRGIDLSYGANCKAYISKFNILNCFSVTHDRRSGGPWRDIFKDKAARNFVVLPKDINKMGKTFANKIQQSFYWMAFIFWFPIRRYAIIFNIMDIRYAGSITIFKYFIVVAYRLG